MSDFDLDILEIMRALLVLMGEVDQEIAMANSAEEVKGEAYGTEKTESSWFEVEAGLSSVAQLAKVSVISGEGLFFEWSELLSSMPHMEHYLSLKIMTPLLVAHKRRFCFARE